MVLIYLIYSAPYYPLLVQTGMENGVILDQIILQLQKKQDGCWMKLMMLRTSDVNNKSANNDTQWYKATK